MAAEISETPPLVYRMQNHVEVMPMGASYGKPPVVVSNEELEMIGLVSHADAMLFMSDNSPPHTPKVVHNTWHFLSHQAFSQNRYPPRESEETPQVIKGYMFTPGFIIASAHMAVGRMNRSNGYSFPKFNKASALFLSDMANLMLNAEPPVPLLAR